MSAITNLQQNVSDLKTTNDKVVAELADLKAQVANIPVPGPTAEDEAAIQEQADAIAAEKARLDAAL